MSGPEVRYACNFKGTKSKLLAAIQSIKFCCLCLDNKKQMHSLDTELMHEGWAGAFVTVHSAILDIFGDVAESDVVFSKNICEACLEYVVFCYTFIHNTKQNAKLFKYHLEDLYQRADYIVNNFEYDENSGSAIVITDDLKPDVRNYLNTIEINVDLELTSTDFEIYEDVSNINIEMMKETIVRSENLHNQNVDIEMNTKTDFNNKDVEFNCDCCNRVFSSKSKYEEHTKKIKNTEKYICDCCNKMYLNRNKLIAHFRLQKRKEKNKKTDETKPHFICDCCNKVYYNKGILICHLRSKNKKKFDRKIILRTRLKCRYCPSDTQLCPHRKYLISYRKQKMFKKGRIQVKCEDCDFVCYTPYDLLIHVNKAHLNIHSHVCDSCGKMLYSNIDLKRHMRKYHEQRPICPFCDRKMYSDKCFEEHKEECKKIVKPFKCEKCPASFKSGITLNVHARKHTLQYPCNLCLTVCSSERVLARHKTLIHGQEINLGSREFLCSICQESNFESRRQLLDHMDAHGPYAVHKCVPCNRRFESRAQYSKHVTSYKHKDAVNDRRGRIQCEHCDYSTPQFAHYQSHVNSHHLKVLPYECDLCEKRFPAVHRLNVHKKSHDVNRRRIVCDICGKALGCNTALKKHMRTHTGEKPYPCDSCDMRFISTSARDSHKERKHLGKHVVCPLCGTLTYTPRDLRTHIAKVHWKRKEKLDYRKIDGLTEEHYYLFRDKRLLVMNENEAKMDKRGMT